MRLKDQIIILVAALVATVTGYFASRAGYSTLVPNPTSAAIVFAVVFGFIESIYLSFHYVMWVDSKVRYRKVEVGVFHQRLANTLLGMGYGIVAAIILSGIFAFAAGQFDGEVKWSLWAGEYQRFTDLNTFGSTVVYLLPYAFMIFVPLGMIGNLLYGRVLRPTE